MKRFKVICGDMEEIIEAESHQEAAAKLFTEEEYAVGNEEAEIGAYVSTIEVVGKELWHPVEPLFKKLGIAIGASTAEKSCGESPASGG